MDRIKQRIMKTAEEILIEFGCPDVTFDENVTMYYPAILSAMEEFANARVEEAMRWRDPKEELPELLPGRDYSNNVLAQVEGFTETQVMGLLYVPDEEGRWGYVWGNCYGDINGEAEWDDDYEIIGWRPIE